MTSTGKHARKKFGTRVAAKRGKRRRGKAKVFGKLPVSASKGNAEGFIRGNQ